MGSDQSNQSTINDKNFNVNSFPQQYQFVQEVSSNYGVKGQIFKSRLGDNFVFMKIKNMMKSKNIIKQQQISIQIQRYLSMNHQNFCKILALSNQSKNESLSCSDENPEQIIIFSEWHPHNFQLEFQKNYPNQIFTEQTLWSLMKQIIPAMATLNQYQITHNDLRPQNIFITNQGQFKIFPLSLISNTVGIGKVAKHLDKCFLAPEELLAIYLKEPGNVDHVKADVFTFGMTMLQLASMNSLEDCYFQEKLQIYSDQIEDYLAMISQRYSIQLINIIKQMITYDTDLRPTFQMLLNDINRIPQPQRQQQQIQQPVFAPLVQSQIVQQPVQQVQYVQQPVQQVQPVYQQVSYIPPQPIQPIQPKYEPKIADQKVYYYREPSKLIRAPQIITEGRAEEIKRQLEVAPVYDLPPLQEQSNLQQIPVFDKLYRTSNIPSNNHQYQSYRQQGGNYY